MSNKFIRFGSQYRIISDEDVQVLDKLPSKTFTVVFDERSSEYYLTPIDDFELPERLYGTTINDAKRILSTFEDREQSTGIHLSGIKGAGKTLLAKTVSVYAREQFDYPTITVNNDYHGDRFNKFIQSINAPAIILFDEFEKVYEWSSQDKILTLLDGVYPSKKMFIITSNDSNRISSFLRNRPGRIYYTMKFNSLSPDFIKSYCEENLNGKEHIDSIIKYVSAYTFFSFDMLAAVVEEMNRYDQSLIEVLQFLNIQPESNEEESHTLTVIIDNDVSITIDESLNNFEPNSFYYEINLCDFAGKLHSSEYEMLKFFADEYETIEIKTPNFVSFDPKEGTFVFELSKEMKRMEIRVSRNEDKRFSFTNYLI